MPLSDEFYENLGHQRWFKAREVAEIIGVDEDTVWQYVKDGTLKRPVLLGPRSKRGPLTDIEAFADRWWDGERWRWLDIP